MRGWILLKNLNDYINLMKNDGAAPVILEQNAEQAHVEMTASVLQTWIMVGYFYQMG